MSQENVYLVLALAPAPDVNLAQIFRDDDTWVASVEAMTPFFHRDFECVGTVFGVEKTYSGMDGFRAFELDWLAPWASFRAEVEEAIDVGERVLVLYRVFGRHQGGAQEVGSAVAWIWTVRDGKIARIKGYVNHAEALKAVGLADG